MRNWRAVGVAYLLIQGTAALAWWILLLAWPASRPWFRPPCSSDSMLWAFLLADGILFVGLSWACAWGLARRLSWAWPVLCVHAGAAAYAGLYCWSWPILTSAGWTSAILMTPSTLIPLFLAWRLRPPTGG